MKHCKTLLGITVLLILGGCEAPTSKPKPSITIENYEGAYFKRTTFMVSDLDRALSVYRDVLGFEVAEIKGLGKDSYAYPAFKLPPEANIRFATLSAPGQERTIGLKEVTGVDLPVQVIPYRVATVLRTDDIERDFVKIEAIGLETMPLKLHEFENPTYHFLERAFVDYDGHVVALYEVLKGGFTGETKEK